MKLILRYLFLGFVIVVSVTIYAYLVSKRPVNVEMQYNDPIFNPIKDYTPSNLPKPPFEGKG